MQRAGGRGELRQQYCVIKALERGEFFPSLLSSRATFWSVAAAISANEMSGQRGAENYFASSPLFFPRRRRRSQPIPVRSPALCGSLKVQKLNVAKSLGLSLVACAALTALESGKLFALLFLLSARARARRGQGRNTTLLQRAMRRSDFCPPSRWGFKVYMTAANCAIIYVWNVYKVLSEVLVSFQ